MENCKKGGQLSYVEAVVMPPIYYDGIGPVTVLRGMAHIALCAEQPTVDGSGETERIIVARLVISPENLRQAMGDLALLLSRQGTGAVARAAGDARH